MFLECGLTMKPIKYLRKIVLAKVETLQYQVNCKMRLVELLQSLFSLQGEKN